VYVDNVAAAANATRHLLQLGHVDIAFINGPTTSPICLDRERGYQNALRSAHIKRNTNLTVVGDFSVESGIRGAAKLLAGTSRFTAVFCSNDEMAIGAICALKSEGLRVPEDVSVVGFDDIRFARYSDPPLTTIAQPMRDIGREAMTMMIDRLSNPHGAARKCVLPTQLIVRGSTAAHSTS
jgi:LacI family repressor for deo operon, udp, cdd, tsx, nupC, and nupG